ncbi:putative metabolite transport protein YBR241C [Saccharomyces cerevisiae S288c] [Rhizoctonia solani]|uniref:Putative metabolite transport protein YBR241C [Saccharomyces cerevisiae S288c] n=1 Tax=Rhizoctonia solani TaxID=456999 RepID=A0A0K6GBZ1_9AGAM|nr:putative metabolite transport protein YBR241C [Saccharomyces cerevisiae S288c] [Rhizoctonia solani]
MTRPPSDSIAPTSYLSVAVGWVVICAFQHGYHIAALNQISDVLSCKVSNDPKATADGWLSLCVPMTEAQFGAVTAAFTVGGFAGSLCADRFLNKGRKYAVSWHATLLIVGTLLMGLANSITVLVLGRLVIGFACGIGICTVPIYLSEVSPPAIQGRIGVLNQLGIVFGIFGTSILGLYLAAPSTWRWVVFASGLISAAQLVWGLFVVESPSWLRAQGRTEEATHVASRLWDVTRAVSRDEGEALLQSEVEAHVPDQTAEGSDRPAINVPTLLASSDLHKPMAIGLVAMFVQQASGINAVMYYSNNILSRVVPREAAAYTSLGITVLNAIMTFPAIFLVDRLGRKRLFMASMIGAIVSNVVLGFALDNGITALSSVAVLGFIASFAVGLGPVPFVMISELTPYYAVSAMSSLSLAVNWSTNFLIGIAFLPLRNFLAKLSFGDAVPEGSGEGRIFYVFVIVMIICTLYLSKAWKPSALRT